MTENAAPSALLRGVGRHALWNYVPMVVGIVTNVTVTAYVARQLGLAQLGLFAILAAVLALLQSVDFSLSTAVQRDAAIATGDHDESARMDARGRLERTSSCYASFGAVVLAAGLLLVPLSTYIVSVPAGQRADLRLTVALMATGSAITMFMAAPQGVLTGLRRFDVLAVAALGSAAVNLTVVFVLTPRIGLPAIGVAQLATAVAARAFVSGVSRRIAPWFRWRPRLVTAADVREVFHAGGSLVVFSIALQVITATDLLVVGHIAGPRAAGEFRLGVAVTAQAAAAIFQGYDVIFPSLAGARSLDAQVHATRWLTPATCWVAGTGLGLLVSFRGHVAPLLAGVTSHTTANVVVLLSIAWGVNTIVHGWALLLIARGLAPRLMRLVLAEVVANAILTVVLVDLAGATGSAVATLVVVSVTNLGWVPLLLHDVVPRAAKVVVRDGVPALLGGGGCALVAYFASTHALAGGAAAGAALGLAIVLAGCIGALLLGRGGRAQASMLFARYLPHSTAERKPVREC